MTLHPAALGGLNVFAAMVRGFYDLGYVCTTFGAFSPARRDLILRHDIDVDLESALAMARLERAQGWCATYFVLPHAGYDLQSSGSRAAIQVICEAGHDIGLHFDPLAYGPISDLDRTVAVECDRLAQLLGRSIDVVAPHQPSKVCPEWFGWDHAPGGRLNAYHPRFFHDAAYVSDSGGAWSHGHPLDHPKVAAGRGIQILTHPHLW